MITTDSASRSDAFDNGYMLGYSDALNDVFEAVEELPLSNPQIDTVVNGLKPVRDSYLLKQES